VDGEAPRSTTLVAHSAEVWGIGLSGDSRLAATAGFDGAVRLWDLTDGLAEIANMHPDRPYQRMNITGLLGVTATERSGLISLGAVGGV
jgi:WD40 repeat protein